MNLHTKTTQAVLNMMPADKFKNTENGIKSTWLDQPLKRKQVESFTHVTEKVVKYRVLAEFAKMDFAEPNVINKETVNIVIHNARITRWVCNELLRKEQE